MAISSAKRGPHDELVNAVRFESQGFEELRRLDAGCPDDEFGGQHLTTRQPQTIAKDLVHAHTGVHLHAQLGQHRLRDLREPRRQRRQHGVSNGAADAKSLLLPGHVIAKRSLIQRSTRKEDPRAGEASDVATRLNSLFDMHASAVATVRMDVRSYRFATISTDAHFEITGRESPNLRLYDRT